MTLKEACEACAKRKVRCDRQEPCSNCKRRKKDRCTYASVTPADRIRRLEALVRRLGADPNNTIAINDQLRPEQALSISTPSSSTTTRLDSEQVATPIEARSNDPVILEENGQPFYLESRAWQGWLGTSINENETRATGNKNPFLLRKRPHALSSITQGQNAVNILARHPPPEQANVLWKIFGLRVEPIVRISYKWTHDQLRETSLDIGKRASLSPSEQAYLFSIYLISIHSLTDEECQSMLHDSRSILLAHYHTHCEEALLRTNMLCMPDIVVIKAIVLYVMASLDTYSTHSLWSIVGLALRNAEKLGMHRDGLALGLSAIDTEERRRVWWQLQHIDLCLGVLAGLTPMTLMADWDAKIPSNIEDEDLHQTTSGIPKERNGLTSLSYCLYTYWVLDQQRQIFKAKQGCFALTWQANTSLAPGLRESVTSQLEDGLNRNFIQYCDPLKPLDLLLQLSARFLIVGFQMRILHASVFNANQQVSEENRAAILGMSKQCLGYHVAMLSQPSLERFKWYLRTMFSWHALMFILVEVSRETDTSKAQETWELLANLYSTNTTLSELSGDRRRHHAAEMIVTAWKSSRKRLEKQGIQTPDFVLGLEHALETHRTGGFQDNGSTVRKNNFQQVGIPATPESSILEHDMGTVFDIDFQDIDFQDIDWSYWNSME